MGGWTVAAALRTLARKWNATLVTTNTRHFTGLGIALEDWTS
jgi:hypothetical protein